MLLTKMQCLLPLALSWANQKAMSVTSGDGRSSIRHGERLINNDDSSTSGHGEGVHWDGGVKGYDWRGNGPQKWRCQTHYDDYNCDMEN